MFEPNMPGPARSPRQCATKAQGHCASWHLALGAPGTAAAAAPASRGTPSTRSILASCPPVDGVTWNPPLYVLTAKSGEFPDTALEGEQERSRFWISKFPSPTGRATKTRALVVEHSPRFCTTENNSSGRPGSAWSSRVARRDPRSSRPPIHRELDIRPLLPIPIWCVTSLRMAIKDGEHMSQRTDTIGDDNHCNVYFTRDALSGLFYKEAGKMASPLEEPAARLLPRSRPCWSPKLSTAGRTALEVCRTSRLVANFKYTPAMNWPDTRRIEALGDQQGPEARNGMPSISRASEPPGWRASVAHTGRSQDPEQTMPPTTPGYHHSLLISSAGPVQSRSHGLTGFPPPSRVTSKQRRAESPKARDCGRSYPRRLGTTSARRRACPLRRAVSTIGLWDAGCHALPRRLTAARILGETWQWMADEFRLRWGVGSGAVATTRDRFTG
ncbi:hypothetical protein JHW43_002482 [Diplocarpon mali]|nr:hypothetical protein JHW43_002482 [Diplocarpon mali]